MNDISLENSRNYESLVNKSKEIKASKEIGGTAFGEILLAQSSNLETFNASLKLIQENSTLTTNNGGLDIRI